MRNPALLFVVALTAAACGASPAPAIGDAAPACEPGVRYECDCPGQATKGSALCSASATRGGCDCQGATPEPTEDGGGPPDASCDAPVTYYRDADGDGYGSGVPLAACEQPVGWVTDNTDCDDTDDRAHPGQTAFFKTPRVNAPLNLQFDFDCNNGTTKCCTEADSCESQGCR